MADFMCKDHSCTVSHEASRSVPWCSVMESWMQTESEQARRKTQNLDLYAIVSLVQFFFATLLGFPPGSKVKPTKKMETASKDPTGCKLGGGGADT